VFESGNITRLGVDTLNLRNDAVRGQRLAYQFRVTTVIFQMQNL
jgi:hypothetical protein